MAGIGQRFPGCDQNVPWNLQVPYNMGRTIAHDSSSNSLNKSYLYNLHSTAAEKRNFYSEENGEANSTGAMLANSFNSRPPNNFYMGGTSDKDNFYQQRNGESNMGLPDSRMTAAPGSRIGVPSYMNVDSSSAAMLPQQPQPQQQPRPGLILPQQFNSQAVNLKARNFFGAGGGSGSGSGGSTTPVTLDPSEFPSLSVGRPLQGMTGQQMSLTSNQQSTSAVAAAQVQAVLQRNYVTTVTSRSTCPLSDQNEFTIQQEDFPALPGSLNQPSTSLASSISGPSLHPVQPMTLLQRPPAPSTTVSQLLQQQRQFGATQSTSSHPSTSRTQPYHIQFLPDHVITNIPASMITDQFGIVGMIKMNKLDAEDHALSLLAPGVDMPSLGVHPKPSGEYIHTSFASPWQETCMGYPQDMDFPVPTEYQIRHLISGTLPEPTLDKLHDEALFWIFSNCVKEESQVVAAKQLFQRGWRFHKKEKVWVMRSKGHEVQQNDVGERGMYIVWDPVELKTHTRHMTLSYEDLDRPDTHGNANRLLFGYHNHHASGASPVPTNVSLQ